ncbi:YbjN domain-containing protein [Staphylococcus nepalensis]|uniref:YbjN domain-containing protein n=1 Tax=Staphylococcus nepalensis TaxID=214473 RepID=UPI0024BA17EB|nr:YbjN domain-containing protein [Staphylococcus nepalensis]
MSEAGKKFKELFEKFGVIESIDENDDNYELYRFTCKTKKLYDKDNVFHSLDNIIFALVYDKFDKDCGLFCFKIDSYKENNDEGLQIINYINRKFEHGKYTLDNTGDIDWEYRFDLNFLNTENIKKILDSFFNSLILFVMLKRQQKEQKEKI